jgi:hypothetical protein
VALVVAHRDSLRTLSLDVSLPDSYAEEAVALHRLLLSVGSADTLCLHLRRGEHARSLPVSVASLRPIPRLGDVAQHLTLDMAGTSLARRASRFRADCSCATAAWRRLGRWCCSARPANDGPL